MLPCASAAIPWPSSAISPASMPPEPCAPAPRGASPRITCTASFASGHSSCAGRASGSNCRCSARRPPAPTTSAAPTAGNTPSRNASSRRGGLAIDAGAGDGEGLFLARVLGASGEVIALERDEAALAAMATNAALNDLGQLTVIPVHAEGDAPAAYPALDAVCGERDPDFIVIEAVGEEAAILAVLMPSWRAAHPSPGDLPVPPRPARGDGIPRRAPRTPGLPLLRVRRPHQHAAPPRLAQSPLAPPSRRPRCRGSHIPHPRGTPRNSISRPAAVPGDRRRALPRALQPLRLLPLLDVRVVPAEQDFRHAPAVVLRRPRVLWMLQQPVRERLLRRRLVPRARPAHAGSRRR